MGVQRGQGAGDAGEGVSNPAPRVIRMPAGIRASEQLQLRTGTPTPRIVCYQARRRYQEHPRHAAQRRMAATVVICPAGPGLRGR